MNDHIPPSRGYAARFSLAHYQPDSKRANPPAKASAGTAERDSNLHFQSVQDQYFNRKKKQ
jgi:hypothetical protein